jgi:hypothetical protein
LWHLSPSLSFFDFFFPLKTPSGMTGKPAPIRSLPSPSKKRKPNLAPPFPVAPHIESLESTLIDAAQSSASLNPLADLLDLAQTAADARDVSRAIYALYRGFVVLLGTGRMITGVKGQNAGGEEGNIVRAWLWERLGLYGDLLVGLMKDEDSGLRVCLFIMSFQSGTNLPVDILPSNIIFTPKTPFISTLLPQRAASVSLTSFQKDCFRFTCLSVFSTQRS